MKKGSLLIKNADYVVTCDSQDRVFEKADVLIDDEKIVAVRGQRYWQAAGITSVGSDERKIVNCPDDDEEWQANEVIDAKGMIIYPGLVNTHHHFYQIFTRNIGAVQNLELFPWLKYLYEIWKNLNEETVHYSTLTALGELLLTGCTTAVDHHYVFPAGAGLLIDRQFEAASLIGARMVATRGSMDLSVKDGGLPPDSVVQTIDQIMDDSERLVKSYHSAAPYSMRQVVLAPCSPFSVSADLLRESAVLARELGVCLHTHLCETKDEENYMLENHGIRPLEYMERLGWVGNDVWYAHGIHFTDEELDFLAETGTGVAHCPVSNMNLSSGIAKISEMLRKGVKVGLAVDGSASNDGSNLLEEIRVAFLLHRLAKSNNAPTGYDILKMATVGSASLIGRDDLGSIDKDKAADLFMIDRNQETLIAADLDPAAMLGTVGYKGKTAYTIVNGQIVVQDGRLVNIDEEELVVKANEAAKQMLVS